MKIYDAFLFFNELDLLDIRLNLLNDVVDKFVILESTAKTTGESSGFNIVVFDCNKLCKF